MDIAQSQWPTLELDTTLLPGKLIYIMASSLDCAPTKILHLEDSAVDHELALHALRKANFQVVAERVQTLNAFAAQVSCESFDLVLADYRLPGFTALDAWAIVESLDAPPPFVILSGAIGEEAAVDAMRRGVTDYLLKDSVGKLPHVIMRAIEISSMRKERIKANAELAASEQRLAEFAARLQESIEQERAAIAREVHDDIGGALTAIRFDLSWIERHGHGSELMTHVVSANAMLQHAMGASQRIMMNLRPAILDQGLLPALQWLVAGFTARTGIAGDVRGGPLDADLAKDVEIVAYRTAQEALTNVGKHAQCSEVFIEISGAKDALTLEIADNGKGIAHGALLATNGFGLKGLRERARTVGGWLDVTTRHGLGTSIILTVPLSGRPTA